MLILVVGVQALALIFALALCRAGDDPEPHELGPERSAVRAGFEPAPNP